jgi:hypothetical protein
MRPAGDGPSYRDAVLGAIARRILLIPTPTCRGSDADDFHDVGVFLLRDALRAAYAAGRRATHGEAHQPTQVDGDLVLTSTLPAHGAAAWMAGYYGDFWFSAKVHPGHAVEVSYELNRSGISKLLLRWLHDDTVAFNFDRGLDHPAQHPDVEVAVVALCARLPALLNRAAG